jgi:hypothetical protein
MDALHFAISMELCAICYTLFVLINSINIFQNICVLMNNIVYNVY